MLILNDKAKYNNFDYPYNNWLPINSKETTNQLTKYDWCSPNCDDPMSALKIQ